MIDALIKTLYYYEFLLATIGVLIILKSKNIGLISIVVAVFFSIVWRSYTYTISSRYFCIIIFACFFFIAYGIKRLAYKKRTKKTIILVLIACLFSIHIPKVFLSFRNTYISDVQESIRRINIKNSEDDICIIEKEYARLKIAEAKREIGLIPFETDNEIYDLNDIYLKFSSLANKLYIVISEKNKKRHDNIFNEKKYRTIEQFITGFNHDKHLSVIEYYPPTPNLNMNVSFKGARLKAYVPEYDTFIYYLNNRLIWLIGGDIEEKTEIIYHAYTNYPALLPASRVKYGFDNMGFYITDQKYEQDSIGKYRVFIRDIPNSYPISYFRAGFKKGDIFIWRKFWVKHIAN